MSDRQVGISLGLIDSLDDGLGEFSTQICERVAAAAPQWHSVHGVRFHLHLPARWFGRFGDQVGYLAAAKSQGYLHVQRSRRFDVWHGLNQLGRIGPPLATRHAVLTIHDLNTVHHDTPTVVDKVLGKMRKRLRKFDAVTTLTHHVENDIRRHLGWGGPIDVIPNGARDLTAHAREAVPGLPEGRFLLHLSRMSPSKNPQSLVELAAAWPEQAVVLAGPRSAESDALKRQARDRGLANLRVVQEVNDAQKTWLYAHCQAFLFPSLTEGFGLPPIEAMHFGKPVFLSRLTSLPEVGGDCAAYFDSFDALAMRRCIESESPRLTAGEQAIRAHAAQFSWDRAAAAYFSIYRRALGIA